MASLILEDVPETLLRQLEERAAVDSLSLSQETVRLLERALQQDVPNALSEEQLQQHVQEQVEAWRRLAGSWVSSESVEDEIRHIYEGRAKPREVDW